MSQLTIGGVKTYFPPGKKPFPQQISIMQNIIASCVRKENALLESPTGTGKTIALLCGSLSWQKHHYAEMVQQNGKLMLEYQAQLQQLAEKQKQKVEDVVVLDDDEDFVPDLSRKKVKSTQPPKETKSEDKLVVQPKNEIVRIFYSSRTHTQLAQVVAELKRCSPELIAGADDKGLRMCVLGSRDQYCVNPSVSKQTKISKNDACAELRKDNACSFFATTKISKLAITSTRIISDLEDLYKSGKHEVACPFYASKQLATTADIIFLPYNYLIDASIRESMKIDITGSVLIFDEAHNVEDVARDSASVECTLESLHLVSMLLHKISKEKPEYKIEADRLSDLISTLASWASQRPAATADNGLKEENRIVLEGPEAIASWALEGLILNQETVNEYKACLKKLREKEPLEPSSSQDEKPSNSKQKEQDPLFGSGFSNLTEQILNALGYLVMENCRFSRDFRIATVSKFSPQDLQIPIGLEDEEGNSARSRKTKKLGSNLSFCLWCLNPAVAFRALREKARSIILTSGTLSPLQAFASELDCDFKHRLEATHVCDIRERLFACAIERVGNERLDSTFHNAERHPFLHAIGETISSVASDTPGGVLVFFPSYPWLERCMKLWKSTSLWDELNSIKPVAFETKGSSEEFDKSIQNYRKLCKEESGGIFFAVFRGKLSEGIDFKDEQARAVIIIGIPFPNTKDLVLALKQAHQEKIRKRAPKDALSRPLSGSEWYRQQGFRALNQALGRVIRHSQDYGAIILLDHRFVLPETRENLSRWMRSAISGGMRLEAKQHIPGIREFFDRLEPKKNFLVTTQQSQATPTIPHPAVNSVSPHTQESSSSEVIELSDSEEDEPMGNKKSIHHRPQMRYPPSN